MAIFFYQMELPADILDDVTGLDAFQQSLGFKFLVAAMKKFVPATAIHFIPLRGPVLMRTVSHRRWNFSHSRIFPIMALHSPLVPPLRKRCPPGYGRSFYCGPGKSHLVSAVARARGGNSIFFGEIKIRSPQVRPSEVFALRRIAAFDHVLLHLD